MCKLSIYTLEVYGGLLLESVGRGDPDVVSRLLMDHGLHLVIDIVQ